MSDDTESFLQGGIDNIKLIADKVWGEFDYGTEFKDVFANISRRESLISHRFATTSSADILSDLKFPRNEFSTSGSSYDDNGDYNEDDDILKGEIFRLSDETGGGETYDYLHNANLEDKIDSSYWEDCKAVGQGRHPETNITYNNAFDPRLSFSGLCNDQCLLDDLEQDVSVQHNVYLNVEDIADIVDEYFNKYREYLNELKGSKKQQLRIAKKILAKQPPKIHESRIKAFDVKKSYRNDDEQAMSEIIGSRLVKRYWKKSYYKNRLCRDRLRGRVPQKQTGSGAAAEVRPNQEERETGTTTEQNEINYRPPMNKFQEPGHTNTGFYGTVFQPQMSPVENLPTIWNDIRKSSNLFQTAMPSPSNEETRRGYLGECSPLKGAMDSQLKEIPREPWTKSERCDPSNPQMADDLVRNMDAQFANSMSFNSWLNTSEPEPTRGKSSLATNDPVSSNIWSGRNDKDAEPFNMAPNVTLSTSNPAAPRYIWTDAWSIEKLSGPSETLRNEEDHIIQRDKRGDNEKFLIDQWNLSNIAADIEKPRPSYEYGRNQESPNYHQSKNTSQNPRNTSKAFSETSIVKQQGEFRSQPGAKLTRFHTRDKDSAKSMLRSESSHTGVIGVHGVHHDQKISPRESTQRTFTEGDSLAKASKNPTRGHSEIFPKESEDVPSLDSNTPQVKSESISFVPGCGRIFEQCSYNPSTSSSESRFHDALKRYGWYTDNFSELEMSYPAGSRQNQHKGIKDEDRFGQACEPPRPTKQTSSHSSASATKRQLFRSPSPTKRFVHSRANFRNSISPSSSENWSRSSSISPVKHHLIHNSSLNSDVSSLKAGSLDSSVHSPEPNKTASQLNASCEPFVPAHMKSQDPSPPQTPVKVQDNTNKQKMTPSPNHEAIKRLLQSPEVLVHMLANNDAKQAFLIQQAQQQIQQQPLQTSAPQSPYRSPKQPTTSAAHPKYTVLQKPTTGAATRKELPAASQQPPNVIRRDAVMQPPHQVNLGVINQRPNHSQAQHCTIAHPQIPIHHLPPQFVRTGGLIPTWTCPTAPPPPPQVSRPLGVNIAFAEPPRPRTVPIAQQRYGPPLIAWQAIPSYNPTPARIIHHSFVNLSNVNNNCSVNYDDVSSAFNGGNDATFGYGDVKATKETSSTRGARPIRANPDNLIHISTK